MPSEYSLSMLSPAMRLSILAALPALGRGTKGYGHAARPLLRTWEAPVLA